MTTTTEGTRAPVSRFLTPRNLLIRGLLAGLVAGILAFAVGYFVGEPSVDDAIALEEANSAAADDTAEDTSEGAAGHSHDEGEEAGHSHSDEEEAAGPSRSTQKTWGLLTATVAVGVALGGIVALFAAGVMGRLGRAERRIRPAESVVFAAAVGFVAVALVPWMKYPAAPPAVGSGETIGHRTAVYFGFLAISIAAAALSIWLGQRLWAGVGPYVGVVGGGAAFIVITVIGAILMPVVDELGDFPADVLWSFRLASLLTLATMWGAIAVVLAALVARLDASERADQGRRDLAASL